MPTVPFVDLAAQYAALQDEVLAALREVCESGRYTLGPAVEAFEQDFAAYCQTSHCVAVNSGTSALHLALRCLGVGPGDEVITVPMTFVATAWAICYCGATPVFVDIHPETRTLNPARLEAAVTPRTKAIIPVHLYGRPADLDPILAIADAHGIPVVDDAAQAHGARYKGRRVGGLGRIGCFSFYPSKNLGAYGEGGAVVTNDPDVAAMARALRDHAQRQRYRHDSVGYNYRMAAFQGAILRVKLRRLDAWNAARRRHAAAYAGRLGGLDALTLPRERQGVEAVYHLYVVELDGRDAAAAHLNAAGIHTGLHYPVPVHRQPAFAHLNLSEGTLPVAERLARRCLSLPMFPELTDEQIAYVCRHLAAFVNRQPVVSDPD